jgi:hypothetical protein
MCQKFNIEFFVFMNFYFKVNIYLNEYLSKHIKTYHNKLTFILLHFFCFSIYHIRYFVLILKKLISTNLFVNFKNDKISFETYNINRVSIEISKFRLFLFY